MKLNVKTDVREVERFMRELDQRSIRKAAGRAINDSLITVRKDGAQEIKKKHPALKIGDIKRNMVMKRAGYGEGRLHGSIDVSGKSMSLKLFQPRGTGVSTAKGKGVTARIGKDRKLIMHRGRKAFIVHKYDDEIFVRRHEEGRQIRRFRGPSMPGVFRAQEKKYQSIARARFAVAFPSRLKYEIDLAKRKAMRGA